MIESGRIGWIFLVYILYIIYSRKLLLLILKKTEKVIRTMDEPEELVEAEEEYLKKGMDYKSRNECFR